MDEAMKIILGMMDELQDQCPREFSTENNYTEIMDKIELLQEVIDRLKSAI